MHGDVAAVGLGLAFILPVEDHLREGDRKDGKDCGQHVDLESDQEPAGAEHDQGDLHSRVREESAGPGAQPVADL